MADHDDHVRRIDTGPDAGEVPALLRLAASGRRDYAEEAPAGQAEVLETQAAAMETAARIAEGDRHALRAYLPSARWCEIPAAAPSAGTAALVLPEPDGLEAVEDDETADPVDVVAAAIDESITEFVDLRVSDYGYEADPRAAAQIAVDALQAAGLLRAVPDTGPDRVAGAVPVRDSGSVSLEDLRDTYEPVTEPATARSHLRQVAYEHREWADHGIVPVRLGWLRALDARAAPAGTFAAIARDAAALAPEHDRQTVARAVLMVPAMLHELGEMVGLPLGNRSASAVLTAIGRTLGAPDGAAARATERVNATLAGVLATGERPTWGAESLAAEPAGDTGPDAEGPQ